MLKVESKVKLFVKKNMKMNENGNQKAELKMAGRETAEQWWARIPSGQKVLAQAIAGMIEELDGRKRIEIRWEGNSVRARFIHILEKPEAGCVRAIVLPERASGGWN